LLPSVFAVPKWDPLSNYPSSTVYPARSFSVSGFFVLERTVAQMYLSNVLDGLLIDLGYHWADVSAVFDGFLLT